MKAFINKTILILISFSIGILSLVLLIHFITKHTSDYSVSEDANYLILGHSHPETAFNDKLIANFKNLSNSGESYFYTYQKVKELIPKNSIDAIFVEYTNNLIRKKMDQWIWGYEKMNANFPWHSTTMGKEDMLYLYKKNPTDFPKAVSTSTRNNLSRILSLDFISVDERYGGFMKLNEKIDETENDISNSNEAQGISIENLNYLEKIVDYCNNNNVKVYFVRSPQHRHYERENEEDLLRIKKQKFDSIDFLDFDDFPLEDDKFADFGHLNYDGAGIFSSWFNQLVENGLLSIENKAAFINDEMEKVREQITMSKN